MTTLHNLAPQGSVRTFQRLLLCLLLAGLASCTGCQQRPMASTLQYSETTVQQLQDRMDAMDW